MKTVSHTLFYPLLGRATAARRWPDVFSDPWAEQAAEIARREGTPAQELGTFPALVYGLRHLITVVEVKRYLKTHPGAAVVNIGCGLDSLALDLQGEECTIYNLDFPDVIEMRKRWIDAHDNEIDLPFSVTDHQWMDEVDDSKGMVAVAPGVMYYLEVEDVRQLVRAMAERFPGGRFSYDSESPEFIKFSEKMIAKKGTPCVMPFKVDDPAIAATWSDKVADIRVEFNFSDYLEPHARKRLPLFSRVSFWYIERKQSMYQVTMDFQQ